MPDPLNALRSSIHTDADRVRWACILEATAPKAGNVYPGVGFSDLQYADFVAAADAIAPCFANGEPSSERPLPRCGKLILNAVTATQSACNTNVNLGIILLLAPLSIARQTFPQAEEIPAKQLQVSVAQVLQDLNTADTADVYAAIQLAKPGGMDDRRMQASESMDVRHAAASSKEMPDLLTAMRSAADRDRIALQYTNGFEDLLSDKLVGTLDRSIRKCGDILCGIQRAQIEILAEQPDSLIARKAGQEIACEAQQRAGQVIDKNHSPKAWQSFDQWLRADGNQRNPGTTADLLAAALWVLL